VTFFRGVRMRVLALTCLVALVFPGSTFSSFGEFTIRDELELARKFDLVIETRFPVIQDARITGYVSSLVDRLIATMPPQPFPIKTTVVRNQALNAFASAAGHITIFTGLIANLETEDELASVIAHELAHVSERHIAKSIEKSQLVGAGSLLGILAGVLVGSQGGVMAPEPWCSVPWPVPRPCSSSTPAKTRRTRISTGLATLWMPVLLRLA